MESQAIKTPVEVHIVSREKIKRRINTALAHNGEKLRTSRSSAELHNLGKYYMLGNYRNEVVDHHIDLLTLANKLRVIADDELLAEE